MANTVKQMRITSQNSLRSNQLVEEVALFNSDGSVRIVPEQAEAQADVAAMTSAAITGGESPTEAEHNALRADVVALRTVLNSLLAKLRTAGVIDT